MDSDENNSEVEFDFTPCQTPTTATDFINIGMGENGSLLLQLMSVMPKNLYENHRTVVSSLFVRDFIDALCEICEYYPAKPKQKKTKKKAAPKKAAMKLRIKSKKQT